MAKRKARAAAPPPSPLEPARCAALALLDTSVANLRHDYAVTDDAMLVPIVPGTTVADHLLKRREAVAHAKTMEDLQAALVKAQRSALNTFLWLWAKQEVRGAATQLNLERHARRAEALAQLLEGRGNEDAAARQRERAEQIRRGEVPAAQAHTKRVTAASRFRDLILEGKKDDDTIFKEVQAEFSLGDEKRAYVNWYRKDLIKKGLLKPPEKEAASGTKNEGRGPDAGKPTQRRQGGAAAKGPNRAAAHPDRKPRPVRRGRKGARRSK